MKKPLWDKRFRRRLRTTLLAIVATCALFWGAVDIVGVPAWNMVRILGESILLIVALILAAALTGWLLHRWRGNSSD